MTRALECADASVQHPVLMCLAPWMENLTVQPHWKVGVTQLEGESSGKTSVLRSMTPAWAPHPPLSKPLDPNCGPPQGTWCERLLKSMYYVTQRHGTSFPFEIERLWSTLAACKRNIIPCLDFLLTQGVHAALQVSGYF